jgi:hypothetical protein
MMEEKAATAKPKATTQAKRVEEFTVDWNLLENAMEEMTAAHAYISLADQKLYGKKSNTHLANTVHFLAEAMLNLKNYTKENRP